MSIRSTMKVTPTTVRTMNTTPCPINPPVPLRLQPRQHQESRPQWFQLRKTRTITIINQFQIRDLRSMRTLFLLCLALAVFAPRCFSQAMLRPGDTFEMRLAGMPPEYAQEFM